MTPTHDTTPPAVPPPSEADLAVDLPASYAYLLSPPRADKWPFRICGVAIRRAIASEAKVARLRAVPPPFTGTVIIMAERYNELLAAEAAVARLAAEVKRLREALRPFARIPDVVHPELADSQGLILCQGHYSLGANLGDCRRARKEYDHAP